MTAKIKLYTVAALALATALFAFDTAPAVADDTGEIKYRKAVMKAVGGHMGALSTIVKGQTANTGDMVAHAQGMLALAKITPSVFPEGSDAFAGKTEALDTVWSDPAGFKKVTDAFIAESEKVVAAAKTGDRGKLGTALGGLGKNGCKACHDGYREKKK